MQFLHETLNPALVDAFNRIQQRNIDSSPFTKPDERLDVFGEAKPTEPKPGTEERRAYA
jgi:hypothetical protein